MASPTTKTISMRDRMEDREISPDILDKAERLPCYALLTPPGKEFVAQKIVRRYGLDTYVAVRREWRRRNKFVKEKELMEYAAVPRIVFGFFPMRPLWFELFSLPVIAGVVGHDGEPLRMPAREIARFIRKTGGGLNAPMAQKFMRTHREFAVGQTVEVIAGPFEGRKVPVIEISGPRAKVLMEFFGEALPVEIAAEMLQAA